MSELSEQEGAAEARKAQQFFRDAINCCVEKNCVKFTQMVEHYLTNHANITFLDVFEGFQTEGKNLLHIASSSGCNEIVKFILSKAGDKVNSIVNIADQKGFTPLMYATNSESLDVMETLIANKCDVNKINCDGAAAIHFAAGDGSVDRMKCLVQAGSNVSISTQAGTPLHWAAGKGHTAAVRYLRVLVVYVIGTVYIYLVS